MHALQTLFIALPFQYSHIQRRQNEVHTDQNVKLKPTVLFRTTLTHYMVLLQTLLYRISTMQSFLHSEA